METKRNKNTGLTPALHTARSRQRSTHLHTSKQKKICICLKITLKKKKKRTGPGHTGISWPSEDFPKLLTGDVSGSQRPLHL